MPTLKQVMTELKSLGTEQTLKTYARHGITEDTFGVKVGDLKKVFKKIKGDQQLALDLYETGNYDAMYLAGMVADGSKMTRKQIEDWAKNAKWPAIAYTTISWIATESPHAQTLAAKWIKSRNPHIATSGWTTYSGIVTTTDDADLDLNLLRDLLKLIESKIATAKNRVRYAMNGFVISVGCYVAPLTDAARKTAKAIGTVEVDMGDTACKVPDATAYIDKVESMNRIGKKRKTIRC